MEWVVLKYASYYSQDNILASNLFVKGTISYYLYLFISQNPKHSTRFASIVTSMYLVFAFTNFFFIQGMNQLNTHCFNAGMLTVIFFVFKYLYDVLFSTESIVITRLPLFWLGAGIIYFYCSLFPILTFFNPLLKLEPDFLENLYNLVPIGNIFLYLGYLMFILCPAVIKN